MGTRERRERERGETRQRMLDAARELFIELGYEGVSMRKVADRAEYSPTALYSHFIGKQDLFHQLCLEDFRRLGQALLATGEATGPIDRIRAIWRTYLEFGAQYPNHYRLLFMVSHGPERVEECEHPETRGNPETDAYALIMLPVREAFGAGLFRAELTDADVVAQTLWAAVHGVITMHIAKSDDGLVDWKPLRERSEVMLEAVLRGLLRDDR